MFASVYSQGHSIWSDVMGSEIDADDFWMHELHKDWVQRHPVLTTGGIKRVVPIILHGDDVQAMKYQNVGVIQWSSTLSPVFSTLKSRLLFAVVPYNLIVKGKTLVKLFEVLAWSFTHMLLGYFPVRGFNDEPFTDAWRSGRAGTPLADGWRAASYSHRADLQWIAAMFYYKNFNMN